MKEKVNNYYVSKSTEELAAQEQQLRESGQIVVRFSQEEWENASSVIQGEMKEFQPHATSKYVATKILKELEKKYPILKEEYHASEYLPIFKSGSRKAYEKKGDFIYNIFDLRDMIEVEEIPVERINILVDGIEDRLLGDTIIELLGDKYPFDVDIYSTNPGKNYMKEKKSPVK